jgi:orotate phosphoribosyltransferase
VSDPGDLSDRVAALTGARRGHFLLESGHHGELWLDLDGLFWRASTIRPLAELLAERLRPQGVEVVCGPLVGGALLAQLVAEHLDVAFAYTERSAGGGKGLYAAEYRLPGTLAARLDGSRVAVVDDVINAGSSVRATTAAVTAAGGRVVALAALLVLGTPATEYADAIGAELHALTTRPTVLWDPRSCPLCARGEPLDAHG